MFRWSLFGLCIGCVIVALVNFGCAQVEQPGFGKHVQGPRSFDECAREKGRILKSFPPKCVTTDGQVFEQARDTAERVCKDQCGDGQCQEIVCKAVGCPCGENVNSCPQDCPERPTLK